jgi:chemotaxis protein MotB
MERQKNDNLNVTIDTLSTKLQQHQEEFTNLDRQVQSHQQTATQLDLDLKTALQIIAEFKALIAKTFQALEGKPWTPSAENAHPIEEARNTLKEASHKLNTILAARVHELEQYRSEFFGKLREALGNHPDIRVAGDRFILQSEVLFASASAQLNPSGQRELAKIAQTIKEITHKIPKNVKWVLRVDGHTDTLPIHSSIFHSNWELSAARALAVVHYLIAQGIPPQNLAATGFGEFQPLPGTELTSDSEQLRRNRRIELRLDQG